MQKINNRFKFSLLVYLTVMPIVHSQTIDCGSNSDLVVCQNSTAQAWGNNTSGQLGYGSAATYSNVPVACSNLSNVVSVCGGWSANYAVKSDGTVWSWGNNSSGQLGIGSTTNSNIPVQIQGLNNVIQISAGWKHAIVLKNDGTVWAWGENYSYQLGNGTSTSSLVPVQVSTLSNIVKIAAGDKHNLALADDGTIWVWGTNGIGQYGNGVFTSQSTPIHLTSINNVIDIGAGYEHSIVLKNDGTVWNWGAGGFGQLGNGTTNFSNVPVQVSGLSDIAMVATTSGNFNLVIKNDGTCWSWGSNSSGQLGNGTSTSSSIPVQINGLSDIVEISGGFEHSMAKKADGKIYTWGFGATGQIGNGANQPSNIPVMLTNVCSALLEINETSVLNVEIFPNPVIDNLTIQMDEIISSIQIRDINGKIISSQIVNSTSCEVDIKDLQTGVYLINFFSSKGVITKQFIKQ